MLRRMVEAVVPARLGTSFRWLLGAVWSMNLGDGLLLAAGPLLVASRTHDAFLVALAAALEWLPPLLFGLWAGVLTDRLDRRRLVMTETTPRVDDELTAAQAVAYGLADEVITARR